MGVEKIYTHITDGHHVKAEQLSSASVIIKEKPAAYHLFFPKQP